MTAWVDIFNASESAPTLSAYYATSANPWTETIWYNVPHWLMGQSGSDTGRLDKNNGKLTVLSPYYYHYSYVRLHWSHRSMINNV
jgi:hypothetical protein